MRVTDQDIIVPDLPHDLTWANFHEEDIDDLLRVGPVLIEFWDFARINSLRTMPYMEEWTRRYAPDGVTILGVHSSGFSFGNDETTVRAAIERLGIQRPIMLDPEFQLWRTFENRGWPARYLFGARGSLKYFHYGEGDYEECELTIQEVLRELDAAAELPEALIEPVRPEDAPGAEMPPQTADLQLPEGTERLKVKGTWDQDEDWIQSTKAGDRVSIKCEAGSAWAVLSGEGVDYPGLHKVKIDAGKATVEAPGPGLRLHGFQFTPVPPA
ncbi:MAG: DipZ protein [Solirubrobacterales bacterium]